MTLAIALKPLYTAVIFSAALISAPVVQAFPPGHITSSAGSAAGQSVAAVANETPESFITDMGEQAVSFLGDETLSREEKEAKFRDLLTAHFDTRTIGRFVMGMNWRRLSDAQKKDYMKLFNDAIIRVYSARFSDYTGQEFVIERVTATSEHDSLVHSYISPRAGQKIPVTWRVRTRDGQHRIIDVAIENISLALSTKSEFASIIQRNGGDPAVILDYIRKRSG